MLNYVKLRLGQARVNSCPHLALHYDPAAVGGVAAGSRSSTADRLISPAEAVISSGAVAD